MVKQWSFFEIPAAWEKKAQDIRANRDKLYKNIFVEEETDLRWVGDLGEIYFNHWLKENNISGVHWHLDNAAGKPDFTINKMKIDVKTVKRKVPPHSTYTAQITARHKNHCIDELFFLSYQFEVKKLWILGGINMNRFIQSATYYGEGDQVHSHYTIRKGHEIYNAPITILQSPNEWLQQLKA
jgi:hypothetical protein